MKEIRWGILGCGKIAQKFAADIQYAEGASLVAAGSRSAEAANHFCAEFGIPHSWSSYEALVNDPDVDVIYIATPHALHHANTLLCLRNHKPVLCEKPFAINQRQAAEMIALAKANGVFLMEALWSKFLPQYAIMEKMVRGGNVGDIQYIRGDFGFRPGPGAPSRLFDPALGGGSLLDTGIYPVFLTVSLLGRPDGVQAVMTPNETGIDDQCAATLTYKNGAIAQVFSSFTTSLSADGEIAGTKGRLRIGPKFYNPEMATMEFYAGTVENNCPIPIPAEPGSGYQHEIRHVGECLRGGLTESPVMTFKDTLLLMETLDRIREVAGIRYAEDEG
jgi:predicted dehydrogenase